jgi:hypothetical protein
MTNLDLKQQFIARAKALSKEPEIFRCTLLTSLICEAIPFGLASEAEFFEAAYGDPTGRDYWDAQLSEPLLVGKFAALLAVHLPIIADQLESARAAVMLALRDAAEAGERWFIGDTKAFLAFAGGDKNFVAAADVKVHPRAAVEWLLSKPKREHLVSGSLRSFVEDRSVAAAKPRSLTTKGAARFVGEFIDRERKAGRRPTLKALRQRPRRPTFGAAVNICATPFTEPRMSW